MLRGEVPLLLREASAEDGARQGRAHARAAPTARPSRRRARSTPPALARFAALKAWRAEVARAHNLPAYVVFHDATLAEMADLRPDSLDALAGISGVGARKLDAYGEQILARAARRPDPRRRCHPDRLARRIRSNEADFRRAMASTDPSDDALMKAYADGDAAAFEQLYRRHQAALYRFVRRLLGTSARGADRRGVPGHVAARRQRARALAAAGRRLSHLALHARPPPRHRPAAQERPRGLGRRLRGRGRRALAARGDRVAALARARRRRAARRRARVLAPRRREAARLPRAAAAAAAQRLPAPSRRRPDARRGRARARGRFRDRQDAAALRDEQAAHVHGRLPRAGPQAEGCDRTTPSATPGCAKRCATRPIPARLPPSALSEAILAEARAAAARSTTALPARRAARTPRPSIRSLAFWDWLARPPVAAGFASVHGSDAGRTDVVGPADGRDAGRAAGARSATERRAHPLPPRRPCAAGRGGAGHAWTASAAPRDRAARLRTKRANDAAAASLGRADARRQRPAASSDQAAHETPRSLHREDAARGAQGQREARRRLRPGSEVESKRGAPTAFPPPSCHGAPPATPAPRRCGQAGTATAAGARRANDAPRRASTRGDVAAGSRERAPPRPRRSDDRRRPTRASPGRARGSRRQARRAPAPRRSAAATARAAAGALSAPMAAQWSRQSASGTTVAARRRLARLADRARRRNRRALAARLATLGEQADGDVRATARATLRLIARDRSTVAIVRLDGTTASVETLGAARATLAGDARRPTSPSGCARARRACRPEPAR